MSAAPRPTKAFIVFHGEIIFFDDGDPAGPIFAYAPYMGIHVYSAGPWLAERRIPPKVSTAPASDSLRLELTGVQTGGFRFQDHLGLTIGFEGADPRPSEEIPYMMLTLPRPNAVRVGAKTTFNDSDIEVLPPHRKLPPDDDIALALIFEYCPVDGDTPKLRSANSADGPWAAADVGNGSYNLHIFAEADVIVGAGHITEASKKALSLVGISANVNFRGQGGISWRAAPFRELIAAETNMILSERINWLNCVNNQLHHRLSMPQQTTAFEVPLPFEIKVGPEACGACFAIPKVSK